MTICTGVSTCTATSTQDLSSNRWLQCTTTRAALQSRGTTAPPYAAVAALSVGSHG